MSINPSIFKAYDVRGVYPGEINEETVYLVGRAFAVWLTKKARKQPVIVVGSDARISSPGLKKALVRGILEQGGKIIDIGLATTPMFYFAVNKAKADGGAMVTASHNPAKYNGLKFTLKQARPVGEETGLEEIKAFALRAKFAASVKKGTLKKKLLFKKYVNFMLWQIKNIEMPDLKIAIDSGNGMAGLILPKLFKKIKRIKVFPLYFKIDCGFPNHEANPLKEDTLNDLKNLMRKKKADAGIAFDGDGDRVVFLTAEGRPARADFITALLAGEYLKKYPKAKIAFGVNSSRVVREAIAEKGGRPFVSRIGHSFFKEHLWKEGVVFGGELSGHYYFRDFFNADSGIFTMMKVLKIVAQEKKPLSELIKPFERYFASGEINFEVKDKFGIIKNLEKKFSDGRVSKVDGLSVEYKDWWFNVRSSNTEPLLRLNLEAKTKKILEEKKKMLTIIIKKSS
ncbi:hypothetical protein A3A25_01215 [Candidatus Azambacteria bacterium RIFCSPLOWO2_01_FULL_46_26]|uniref:Phosphomannomutase/phosphoglucomutase n=1 Tax=Candidatus Azambacteria bacterium RIFCSPLOWO2_01_FULL_46_26 TaxID=1797299 RepID=A0A1F5C6A4_9BACT|nr:MAG: hypothetical protein A3A25_01215 [Candidatus Azambacteria bacterium RIFCSPLOWO2_01_FULL_46_26]